jgi:hypothetical protein
MHRLRSLISTTFPWLCLIAALGLGIPLFLRSPLWVDVTYHDMSARNIMWGGIHYRDIFETNFPGMVWAHIAIRSLFGWSSEAIRGADLVVVGGSVLLLTLWLRKVNLALTARVWFVFCAVSFYLFQSEFIHAQRDGWMLLPTVVALLLRCRQVERSADATRRSLFLWGIPEGMCWGCAIWIKPHCIVPAFFCWLVSFRRIDAGIARRPALFDFLGLLVGGSIVGGAGCLWLLKSGTWPYLWDVLLNWNPEYYKWTQKELLNKLNTVCGHFSPWSLAHAVAIPVAILSLYWGRVWRKAPPTGSDHGLMLQSLLAALYLGWLVEATFLQKAFAYSQAPVVLLALAVLASQRWPIGPVFLSWNLVALILHQTAHPVPWVQQKVDEVDHWIPNGVRDGVSGFARDKLDAFEEAKPHTFEMSLPRNYAFSPYRKYAFDPRRLALWSRCLHEQSSAELKDELSFFSYTHCVPTWTELEKVADFLRARNVKDGELVCWYDSTHPLYLELKVRPAIRFMHLTTTMDFKSKLGQIQAELEASGQRYVVSDIMWICYCYKFSFDPWTGGPNGLPEGFPDEVRSVYPWNQPILFRTDRYYVHEVTQPIGSIKTPRLPPEKQED